MHFQEIKDTFFEDSLVTELEKKFSEIDLSFISEEYYSVSRLYELFINNMYNDVLVKKIIDFINYSFEQGLHRTEDVFLIEFFHPSYNNQNAFQILVDNLDEKALNVFKNNYEKYFESQNE